MINDKKIITVMGDSLSMVRIEEGISVKKTYAYQLNNILGDEFYILNKSKRGNTSVVQTSIQNLYDDIEASDSKVIIIQIGIVDCSPRIISRLERLVLNNVLPKTIAGFYIRIKSNNRYFFTKYFPMTYVSPVRFENSYKMLLSSALNLSGIVKVILINIADTNRRNKIRSFGFDKRIVEYNKIITNLAQGNTKIEVIDLYTITKDNPELLLSDGIHIDLKAHEIIAKELAIRIRSSFSKNG
jgi:hypothetical protein